MSYLSDFSKAELLQMQAYDIIRAKDDRSLGIDALIDNQGGVMPNNQNKAFTKSGRQFIRCAPVKTGLFLDEVA